MEINSGFSYTDVPNHCVESVYASMKTHLLMFLDLLLSANLPIDEIDKIKNI